MRNVYKSPNYSDEFDGSIHLSFQLKIPSIGNIIKENKEKFYEHIKKAMMDAFAENDFAKRNKAELNDENKELCKKLKEANKQVEYLTSFKEHFDLAFALAHGKKNDIQ